MSNLIVIRDYFGIEALKAYIADKEYIAFDIETTGVKKGSEIIGFSISAEEDRAYYVITKEWLKEDSRGPARLSPTWLGIEALAIDFIRNLVGKKLICHNGIFDCSMIEQNYGIRLIDSLHSDTMIMAHLINENRRVGLKELAKEYFGDDSTEEQRLMKESVIANGGKLTKDCYELYKGDSELIAKYGAQDALLTYKLFLELVPELYDQGLDKFFYEDESMPLLRGPTYDLNTTGLKVDQTELTKLKKQLEAECLEAKDFIYAEIKEHIKDRYPGTNKRNHFNISSTQHLSWLLFGKLQLEFGRLTDSGKQACRDLGRATPYTYSAKRDFIAMCENAKGQISQPEAIVNGKKVRAKKIKDPWAYIQVDKKTLEKLADKRKWISKLLEYKRKMKILNTYVEGIESAIQYGIISPSFLQHGTTSGRYSSRAPNFQNLPRDDKRVKACITSRPGRTFVGADYSQLEPRVFAYFSGDSRLLEAFRGDADFYSTIGMEVYDKSDCTPHKEGSPNAFGVKYKRLRDLSKVIALASTYGATAHQLAPTTGKSIEDTQQDIDNYFERFPGVAEFMIKSHNIAKTEGEVKNLFGRPRRMPLAKKITKLYGNAPHADLPYDARNMLNLAVNHRIQSTGASIVNRAAIMAHRMYKEADIDCKLLLQVHDSMIVECNEADADNVSLILQHSMETAVELEGIKLEAIPKKGKNLSEV